DLTQQTIGGYFMETIAVLPTTDVAFGGRVQRNLTTARDRLDPNAPGGIFAAPQGLPLDQAETKYAWHLGIDHRVNEHFPLFARAAESFRLPTVDERVGVGFLTNFALRTQTSQDVEGGVRFTYGLVMLQSSVFVMQLRNEIFFSPATFTSTNLDPTRRHGIEN